MADEGRRISTNHRALRSVLPRRRSARVRFSSARHARNVRHPALNSQAHSLDADDFRCILHCSGFHEYPGRQNGESETMTQLWQVTIAMLAFGACIVSLGLWAAWKHDQLNRPTDQSKK